MSIRRIWAITRKETNHIIRDRTTLFLVLFTPTVLLLLMAYALTVDIQHVPLAVLDYDRSPTSRAFVQQITAGDDLDLHAQVSSLSEIEQLLLRGEIKAALVIDPAFSKDLLAARGMPLQIIIDGTEPESGGFAVEHISSRAEQFIDQAIARQIQALGVTLESIQPIDLRVRTWFNPGLNPRVDLIPGLISIVLGFPALSVALTFAHEREHGTLEQLMATPIGRAELLVGKMVPVYRRRPGQRSPHPTPGDAVVRCTIQRQLHPVFFPIGNILVRHPEHGHPDRGIYAHPGRRPGAFIPADLLPRILPDRDIFPDCRHARDRAHGGARASRHPLCFHHTRRIPARCWAGGAVAIFR